jgi:hypothetical protein
MKRFLSLVLLLLAVILQSAAPIVAAAQAADPYPPSKSRIQSPGHTTYFVDPARGDDANAGTDSDAPWKSLAKVNALRLGPGDTVVIAPGRHEETLMPCGEGTAKEPIVIAFHPGVHEFGIEKALRRPWYVSNTNDAPTWPKPIGILVEDVKHLRVQGGGLEGKNKTTILYAGRMIEFVNHRSEDIAYSRLVFDLKRPTVSEFRVLDTAANSVVIQVAEGSTYEIKNGKFAWTGDLGPGWVMVQQAIPETGQCWRMGRWDPFSTAKAEDLGGKGTVPIFAEHSAHALANPDSAKMGLSPLHKVRLTYPKGNFGMIKGRQFQFRPTTRDMAAGVNDRSRDIVFSDCDFYALTNMGIVSQFTENITYRGVRAAPPRDTIRTCPAWADIFHFSNCRGDVLVEDCVFSGSQDDPINVHGTHLRIVGKPAKNQLLLCYMQPQTYGFAPYAPGDVIAVIDHRSLRELPGNPRRKVTACSCDPADSIGKHWIVTLDGPAPAFGQNDVVDNVSWYPNFTARNNSVTMDSCRGFLITTRGKVLVEGNTCTRCAMPGILVEDDAEGWFESGPVRDMLLRRNCFIGCGVEINPHTETPAEPVHENIRIEDNYFDGAGVSAHSVKGLAVTGNRFSGAVSVHAPNCLDVKVKDNTANVKQ